MTEQIQAYATKAREFVRSIPDPYDFVKYRSGSTEIAASIHNLKTDSSFDLYGVDDAQFKDLPWSELSKVFSNREGVRLWNEIATMIDYTFPSKEQLKFVDENNAGDINRAELRYCVKYAAYIYFMAFLGDPDDIEITERKDLTLSSDSNEPGYFIAIDYMYKRILLCIRGTTSIGDVLTDLDANIDAVDFGAGKKYHVHRGIYTTAKKIYFEATLKIKELLQMKKYRDFKLLVTGHSLGAGVCSLLGLLWNIRGTFSADRFSCYSFASPLVIGPKGMGQSKTYKNMISVAVSCDIVTRGCVEGIRTLDRRTRELNSCQTNAKLVEKIVESRSSTENYHDFKRKLKSESLEAFNLVKKLKTIDKNITTYHDVYLYPCGDILWFVPKALATEDPKERYAELAKWIKFESYQNNVMRVVELIKTIYSDFQPPETCEDKKDQKLASIQLQNKKGKNDRFEFTQLIVNGIESWQAHFPGRYARGFGISITDVFKLSGNYPTFYEQTNFSGIGNFVINLVILVQGLCIFFFYNAMPDICAKFISYAFSQIKRLLHPFSTKKSSQRKLYSRVKRRREVTLWNKIAAMCDYTFPSAEKLQVVQTNTDELKYCVRYATYIYFMDLIGDPHGIQIKYRQTLRLPVEKNPPGYFIGVDQEHRYIVLCIRGAEHLGTIDEITLRGMKKGDKVHPRLQNCGNGKEYYLHQGIYKVTMLIYYQVTQRIRYLLSQYDGGVGSYKILVTGHGVGGAICSILGLLWNTHEVFKQEQFASYAFAAPLVIGKNGRKESVTEYRNMTSVAVATDTVSRLSFGGFLILKHRARELKKKNSASLVRGIVNKRCANEEDKEFETALSDEEKGLIARLREKDIDESLFLYPCGRTFWLFPSYAVNERKYEQLRKSINKYKLEGYDIRNLFGGGGEDVLTTMDSDETETKFIRNISGGIESWKTAHVPLRYARGFGVKITDVFKDSSFYHMVWNIMPLPQWLIHFVIWCHAILIILFYQLSLSSKCKNFVVSLHVYPLLWMGKMAAFIDAIWKK